jgi:hypothetical protein
MEQTVERTLSMTPLGAYAVEAVDWELGNSGGKPAIALEITYRRSLTEIRGIHRVSDMDAAARTIEEALSDHAASLVLEVAVYEDADIHQLVSDYVQRYPQYVMETPEVTVGVYPESGQTRIVELKFTYQNSRESLRQMQAQVRTVFEAASLYVSGDASEHQKLSQLYGFLTERFDYKMDTSITPSYSLLCHGVGDSRAFAEVYAAMCRQAELECLIVTGTRDGAPWTWNMVRDGERYYHVDLLRQSGSFREFSDMEMGGYVWDYSAYPVCDAYYQEPTLTAPTEPTEPELVEPIPGNTEETAPETE